MALNKSVGQMYPWCDYTWNPIKGKCNHECIYCYYQSNPRFKDKIGPLHLDEKSLRDDLSKAKTIFVGSSTDMWHFDVPLSQLEHVLDKCWRYPEVTFLFQSKNPARFQYMGWPPKTIIGTTLETNRYTENFSKAPNPIERASFLHKVDYLSTSGCAKMISIEPIMDFDLDEFLYQIGWIKPILKSCRIF
ncbi:hypothetical protein ES703_89884 [subsurface metagenome]